jgi:hypothetical protein
MVMNTSYCNNFITLASPPARTNVVSPEEFFRHAATACLDK